MGGQKTDGRDVVLGRQIAEGRKRAHLTQKNVGDEFGMSAAQIQKYEKGTNRISAIHLAILSRLTGTPVAEFFAALHDSEDEGVRGFAETPQPGLSDDPWTGLATIVAQHVTNHFSEESRRDFAAAIERLNRELNG